MVINDHAKNIQRIVDKLKADSSVYDEGATKGKVRNILFGDPENNKKLPQSLKPYIYVTTRNSLQTTNRDVGVVNPIDSSTTEYEIVIVADSRSKSEVAQKQLYEILKNVRANLESDPTFKHPDTNDDPIFVRSVITDVPLDPETRGKLTTSLSIILLATIGADHTLTVSGFTAIPIRSVQERGVEITEDIYNTARVRKNTAPISETHSLFVEIEYDESQFNQFWTDKGNRAKIPVTLNRPSGTSNYTGKITDISNPIESVDGIKTITLKFEIFH